MSVSLESKTHVYSTRVIKACDGPPFQSVDILSEKRNDGGWAPPKVYSTHGEGLTRGEWETLKKIVDAAFNEFEAKFPSE